MAPCYPCYPLDAIIRTKAVERMEHELAVTSKWN